MAPLPSVSVVVATHRRPELLARCLAAVLADPATGEVIVVQDDDSEATGEVIAATAADERVRRLDGGRTDGSGDRGQHNRSRGAAAASGEVIVSLDDDVVAHPGLVTGHARHHRRAENLLVMGYSPVVLPARGRPGRGVAQLYSEGYERACAGYERDASQVLRALWGGNFSVARRHWLRADELDRVAGGYHDDLSFGLRLQRLELDGVFDRGLRADHWYRRSVAQLGADARASAEGTRRIRAAYGAAARPLPDRRSHAARALAAAARRDRLVATLQAALLRAADGAATHARHGLEKLIARAVWRLNYERAIAGLPSPSPPRHGGGS